MTRCRFCGDTGYPSSTGGPEVCPACDCGMFHDERGAKRLMGRLGPPTCNERRGEDKCGACLGARVDAAGPCAYCLGTGQDHPITTR